MMVKSKLMLVMVIVTALLILAGCKPSKEEVVKQLVLPSEGQLAMHIFSSSKEWDLTVNGVLNSEPSLQRMIR